MHKLAISAAMLQWLLLCRLVLGTPDGATNMSNCGLRENDFEFEDETATSLHASFLQTGETLNRASPVTHSVVPGPGVGALIQLPIVPHKTIFTTCAASAFLIMFLLVRRTIAEYEATATPLMPPWYCHPQTMLKVGGGSLFVWYVLGIVGFNTVFLFSVDSGPRHLTLLESVYLCTQIITTVGYGDLVPASPQGQVFIAVYVLLGVIQMGTFLTALIEAQLSMFASHWSWITSETGKVFKLIYQSDRNESNFSQFFFSLVPVALLAIIGIFFFTSYPGEGLTIWEAFYMTCMTFTTVGFGAVHPKTQGGYAFGAFWMLAGVLAMGNVVVAFSDGLMKKAKGLKATAVTDELLKNMDADGDGKVDRIEFLRFELVRRGFCEAKDFDDILNNFKTIDADGSGELCAADLKLLFQ